MSFGVSYPKDTESYTGPIKILRQREVLKLIFFFSLFSELLGDMGGGKGCN